jgi:hypothetical protein
MKRFQTLAAYLVVLTLAGVATLKSEQPGKTQGKAIVRSVHGTATYSVDGTAMTLKANMELDTGTTITTGPDSWVDLSVNGLASAVRVQPDTTMAISTMDRIGSDREGDTETMLDLKAGTILGQVKKVSANSTYEIKTPHGVAGIRGTDYEVTVVKLPDGQFEVTFTSMHGTVVASAVVNGAIDTKTLNGGEAWTVGGPVFPVKIELLQWQINQINDLIADLENGTTPPPLRLPVTILPVFPCGVQPGQGPSSPHGFKFPHPHPFDEIGGFSLIME